MRKLFKIMMIGIWFGIFGFLGGFVWTIYKILRLPKSEFKSVVDSLEEGNNEMNKEK